MKPNGMTKSQTLVLQAIFRGLDSLVELPKWCFFRLGKEPNCHCSEEVRDVSSIPELGRSPGGGHGNPLQYFCLENPMDRGTWQATVHGATKSQTQLK